MDEQKTIADSGKEKLFTPRFILTLALTALVSAAAVLGAFYLLNSTYGQKRIREFEAVPYVVLSEDLTINADDTLLSKAWLLSSQSDYAKYRSSMLYDTLDENGKAIYRAMECALEEGITYVCVDRRLASGEEELKKVLRCLALDSPLLEQNLRYGTQTFSVRYPINLFASYTVRADFEGYYIAVYNFTDEHWTKKQEALAEAKRVVAELPAGLSAEDKAEVLYRYVALGAEYFDYEIEKQKVPPYLYDALLKGIANCDGYANALALVYRLAGIECVEKTYDGNASTEESGHTWTSFCLDGKWYNADATGNSCVPEEGSALKGGVYYGFADYMQKYVPLFSECYPPCEEGLVIKLDAEITDTDDPKLVQIILNGFYKNNKKWTLIITETLSKPKLQTRVQTVANTLKQAITTRYIELADGRTALFFQTDR